MKNRRQYLIFILLSALLLRLLLSFFGTLELDFNTFIAWSNRLVAFGPKQFYLIWSDYLPGYLYLLWFLGKLKQFLPGIPNEILYKLPAIISDVLSGLIIYVIVRKYVNKKTALVLSFFYLFNPAVLANSSLWGQVDSLTALFSLLSIYLVNISFVGSAFFLAIGTLIKPQASLAALVVLTILIKQKWNIRKILIYIFLSLFVFVVLFLPFFPGGSFIGFIYERIQVTLNQYPYTSVNAFNFWGLWGFWIKDRNTFFSPLILGFAFTLLLALITLTKSIKRKGWEYLLLSVVYLAGFLFFSRMHERHLLVVFAPLVIASSIIPDLLIVYIGLSFTYLANLYYSYIWITQDFKRPFPDLMIRVIILINLGLLGFLVKRIISRKKDTFSFIKIRKDVLNRLGIGGYKNVIRKESFPKISVTFKALKLILLLILLFSLTTRLLWLNKPEEEYFDEVYHAFTARLMLHSDPKAWEWWNPHPEGFAYEWTHPPLAKLGMVLGMRLLGEGAVGWRLPGALLGVGSVFLIYLIAKQIFKDELLAVIAAALFGLDGLGLVMSRIGMNDSYLLFFVLLSLFLYLKDKHFFSALGFGLAVASKWSAIWAIPIFIIAHFVFKKKFMLSYLWFILLPPLVYIISYTQMFLTGHGFDIFIGVQKQMWWYHTRLKATHAYTSSWWSWPLMVRPIYLFVKEGGLTISKIYAMGNPVIFWAGLTGIAMSVYYAFIEKNKQLGFVIFSYFIFFVPWALSPRIMFLYHYLPSIPFMSIALAYVLRKNPKWIVYFFILSFLLFLYFYPHWTGLLISRSLDNSYYWFNSWR